ncbi:hypothetical protein NP493_97g00003 [Ridgeia piscesae]|uniref:Uncharacterized protein n=1 Tax=Ridgeia piscesae TaxID=27915 RepID=A0AAD9UHQ0_RIDPI|nr:hypothetical protein NP493_97g00003 [Ridgeia piscesae]
MLLRDGRLLAGRDVAAQRNDGVSVREDHDDGHHRLRRVDHVAVRLAQEDVLHQVDGLDGRQQPIDEREDVRVEVHLARAPTHEQREQDRHNDGGLDEQEVDFLKARARRVTGRVAL